MTSDSEFDSIRPYLNKEVDQAIQKLSRSSEFLSVFQQLTKMDKNVIVNALSQIHDRDSFQNDFFGPAMEAIIKNTSDGVTVQGLENLRPDTSYLFISNHRDIILDSAILNLLLRKNGLKYTQAAIGSNLLVNEWVTDLVKLNSCFVIERDIPVREMITSFALRSAYIRKTLGEKQNSIWIAQREGRTKNGDDKTQPSLLKMLKMSGSKDFVENLRQLRIVPVSISYEWEPCDDLKTNELYTRTLSEYTKTPEEDMHSMQTGLGSPKGRIHFTIDTPIDTELSQIAALPSNGERLEALARLIDTKIHRNFKLWPNNYIAYDLAHSGNKFSHLYNDQEKEHFIQVMTQKIDRIEGNRSLLNNIFLEIYANPVKNCTNTETPAK
ncbi:1-acyl-sn-glycerol-3-phosphate acyltransferase [Odoribacter lunatus]|uniref:1-acyl-sn-glycerol-3-phosphate acyltransferase n=1 Tax=Odoribacter lunatus TaxID=2941335 RepID=UPI00203DBAB3|nr:1-acyl-sn-glycerol-3-phosphate acyltransferase [Odoribacter lunatus]